MVTRANNTKESISQKLEKPLLKNKRYQFSMYVAKAKNFVEKNRSFPKQAPKVYHQPVVIRIWGVAENCSTQELLYESQPIKNFDWKKINIIFTPKASQEFILIEAFHDEKMADPYNGHVLLDGLSEIVEIP